MKVGTKSVIGGAHCFLLHPFFVAWGWARLFGFPRDVRLWFAFALHDIGYVVCGDMDGPSGERHVLLGARIMGWLFGPAWEDECLRHSRYWSRRMGASDQPIMPGGQVGFRAHSCVAVSADGGMDG